jgi:adsorption protein B
LLIGGIDAVAREAILFAAIWFLVGGLDDLLVDLLFGVRRLVFGRQRTAPVTAGPCRERIAVFVAAWDESAVIGQMLGKALSQWGEGDYRIYVGAYPNDPATIDAVARIAERDARVRLAIGTRDGPTTKADCLNHIWRALLHDEAAEGRQALAVVLHDAEDLAHEHELQVYADALREHEAVQIPVHPLVVAGSPLISGHYCDEFAEAHGKQVPVRQALGAGLPLAGVGCAIRRDMIQRIADARGGQPFDEASLTEDYELGLTIAAMGGRTRFARVPEAPGARSPVAVHAYFPDTFAAAVKQKGRWMTGIALAGWDRTGWGRAANIGDHWMRMRDRRATLEMPVLAVAYLLLVLWPVSVAVHFLAGVHLPSLHPAVLGLLWVNLALLLWRVLVRTLFVWRAYGWRHASLAWLRMLVANAVALAAARRAAMAYARLLAGGVPQWDKTAHHFPDDAERVAA